MITIATSNIRYNGANKLDITVKSAQGNGKLLAPSWSLVGGVKGWREYEPLSFDDYTELYLSMLRSRYIENRVGFLSLLATDSVLCCYCKSNEFCHRHIAADVLCKIADYHKIEYQFKGEI